MGVRDEDGSPELLDHFRTEGMATGEGGGDGHVRQLREVHPVPKRIDVTHVVLPLVEVPQEQGEVHHRVDVLTPPR